MPRIDLDKLRRASVRLGEAVLDPAFWPELMEEVCVALDARGALLVKSDDRAPETTPCTESIREIVDAYFREGWHKRDLRTRGIPLLNHGAAVFTDQEITTAEERAWQPYYGELLNPYDIPWFAGAGFRAGQATWVLSVQRTARQGPFEEDETRLLGGLSQYLTEAATLSTAVGRLALSSAANALGAISHPAIAVDNLGMVIEANPAMGSMLNEDIYIRNNRLVISDPLAQSALDALGLRMTASTDAKAFGDCEPIVIRRRTAAPVVVRTLPVPAAARSPFVGARAILTFETLEPRRPPDAELLAKAFSLTPAEARLAALLAAGKSLSAAAEEFGITRATARIQLKAVFAKTGTHRQSELVALLARL